MGVSDARDMIYAQLSIASDYLSRQLRLEVDYSKSCSALSMCQRTTLTTLITRVTTHTLRVEYE